MIKLNLARNCLRYLIRAYNINEIFLPYYSCNVLWSASRAENCKIKFYHIDNNFMPILNCSHDSFILYINYFGMCDKNCLELSKIYSNLIIDNTHAFYSSSKGLASFNSLRKFFDVQNGAYLYTDKIINETFETDKLLYKPVSMQEDIEQFTQNELKLNKEPIKYISPFVDDYMSSFDYETDKKLRLERYFEYERLYGKYNHIKLIPKQDEVPYCYPLSTDNIKLQEKFEKTKIPLLSLWGIIPNHFPEYKMLNNTVALPLTEVIKVL